jgi:hypothetical protein
MFAAESMHSIASICTKILENIGLGEEFRFEFSVVMDWQLAIKNFY